MEKARVYWGRGSATARWSESAQCEMSHPDRKGDEKRFSGSVSESDARDSRRACANAIEARIRQNAEDGHSCWKIRSVDPDNFDIESKEVG